ncbi:hypothetical protein E8E12_010733 [Didymella heteroderae]|uniref:F-box domain-containing protein n=1 Tax=Didymella heteroderae TaxID=1769908 RepID=A0A9P4WY32_9PLEO|nr:hypothetical protein E8E12_010733 [Didymella heteroderae]
MTSATADAASDWLPELDVIDASWNITAFSYSLLGRFPYELLALIVQYIPTNSLPAVAYISRQLRELAEKNLYSHIVIGDNRGSTTSKDPFWSLLCTLIRRSDLAQMVSIFSGTVYDRNVNIKVETSSIFPDDAHFCSFTKVSLDQVVIAGRTLLELLTRIDKIQLKLYQAHSASYDWMDTSLYKLLALEPLQACRLIPNFDSSTAHRMHFPGLQQLTELDFAGSEFHWALAKL